MCRSWTRTHARALSEGGGARARARAHPRPAVRAARTGMHPSGTRAAALLGLGPLPQVGCGRSFSISHDAACAGAAGGSIPYPA